MQTQNASFYANFVINPSSGSLRSKSHSEILILPPNFVQKVDYDLALNYSHTVEVFSHRICKLLLALPSFLLPPSHGWRHFTNRRTRENKLVVRLIEGCRRIQSIVISVPVQDRSVKGGPLETRICIGQCSIWISYNSIARPRSDHVA
jgi:hypothetical protein